MLTEFHPLKRTFVTTPDFERTREGAKARKTWNPRKVPRSLVVLSHRLTR